MGRAGVLRVLSEDEWTLRPTRRGRAVSLHESKRPRCPRRRRHDRARDYRLKRFELKTENRSRNNGSGQRFIASNGDSRHPTGGVERDAPHRARPPPHQTVRADFPHTASRVGLVSSVSLPFAPRLRFTLIPMDAPPCGRAVSDAPPHSGLSPIAVLRHYCSRHLICIVPFTRRGPSHPRALPHFPATMASSDSSLRFRYTQFSRVPLLNFPNMRPSYAPPRPRSPNRIGHEVLTSHI